jgi:hypothetical protein
MLACPVAIGRGRLLYLSYLRFQAGIFPKSFRPTTCRNDEEGIKEKKVKKADSIVHLQGEGLGLVPCQYFS